MDIFSLKNIIEMSKANEIKMYTSQNRNIELEKEIVDYFDNGYIKVHLTDKFHDRFWICNSGKGFISGTLFNGVGKKISSINYLDENDVKDILKLLLR